MLFFSFQERRLSSSHCCSCTGEIMNGEAVEYTQKTLFGTTQAHNRLHQAFWVFIQCLTYLFLSKYDPTKFLQMVQVSLQLRKEKRAGGFTAAKGHRVLSFALVCLFLQQFVSKITLVDNHFFCSGTDKNIAAQTGCWSTSDMFIPLY